MSNSDNIDVENYNDHGFCMMHVDTEHWCGEWNAI